MFLATSVEVLGLKNALAPSGNVIPCAINISLAVFLGESDVPPPSPPVAKGSSTTSPPPAPPPSDADDKKSGGTLKVLV